MEWDNQIPLESVNQILLESVIQILWITTTMRSVTILSSQAILKNHIYLKDVYIYVVGDNKPDYLMKELYKVVDELNDLIGSIEIYITNDINKENALVYFGDPDEYVKYMNKPHRRDFLKSNWGAAWISPYDYDIRSVDIFINTNGDNELLRRHLLREELTQSLGFPNDSYEYENSIFYGSWSDVTEFSDLDKQLIRKHYN